MIICVRVNFNQVIPFELTKFKNHKSLYKVKINWNTDFIDSIS